MNDTTVNSSSSSSSSDFSLTSTYGTLNASIRSVGTAVTLAAVGIYLHRRNFIVGEGKRTLALISQQVTFPLFLFTKIIHCNQDWSSTPCPDVTKSLEDVWILLIWPAYVVTCGIAVGALVAKWTSTPAHQLRAVMAACGFGNSTGLPITLLTVVHANFPSTSDLGRIDPTLFLSVYLLLYPVLQWSIGGWMLAPSQEEMKPPPQSTQLLVNDSESSNYETQLEALPPSNHRRAASTGGSLAFQRLRSEQQQQQQEQTGLLIGGTPINNLSETLRHNVLNNKEISNYYQKHRRGLSSADEGLYMSELNLAQMAEEAAVAAEEEAAAAAAAKAALRSSIPIPEGSYSQEEDASEYEGHPLLGTGFQATSTRSAPPDYQSTQQANDRHHDYKQKFEDPSFWETCQNVASRCFQPPVIGAIAGIVCATITPLRGLFVDLVDRNADAPLEWIFDGLYSVGLSAVPINMMILGCNLSASFGNEKNVVVANRHSLLPVRTMFGVVIGKMIILPIIGLASAWFLREFVLDIPDDIDGAFYLVLLIVFLTPTANNVMVMVELSGSDAKEGIARVIALQYAFAPILLSLTMTVAIGFASKWS